MSRIAEIVSRMEAPAIKGQHDALRTIERAKKSARHIAYVKKRSARCPRFRAEQKYRQWFYMAMRMTGRRDSKIFRDRIGCSQRELKKHIEDQFTEGMTWENHGEWHFDHIVPCQMWDMTKEDHVRGCWHFSNLRPLWAEENRRREYDFILP